MKAQEYVEQYLPQINDAQGEKEIKEICSSAFVAFLDDAAALVKARKATEDDAIISIINEEGEKWHKFCREMNQQQEIVKFNDSMFIDYWKERLDL